MHHSSYWYGLRFVYSHSYGSNSKVPSLSTIVTVAITGSNMTLAGLKPGSDSVKVNTSSPSHTRSSTMVIVSERLRSLPLVPVGRFISSPATEM